MNIFAGRSLHHIGFLVHDIAPVAEMLGGQLGCPMAAPFDLDINESVIEVGTPGSLRILLARMGTTLFEFIQPLGDEPTVWARALKTRGPGIHHFAFTQIENYAEALPYVQSLGFELTVAGHFGHDRWCYLEGCNMVLELANGAGPPFP
jgi:hypothetical protein